MYLPSFADKFVMLQVIRKVAKLSQQSGQAMLEYLLLLFVVVSIIVGTMQLFSQGVQSYLQNYFGAYLACLLESGELPKLEIDDNSDTVCDDEFVPFTLSSGRPPLGGANNSDSVQGSGSEGSGSSQDGNGSEAESESAASASASTGADGGGGSVGEFNTTGGRTSRVPVSSRGGSAPSVDRTDILGGRNNFASSAADDTEASGRTEYIPIYGSTQNNDEDSQRDDNKVALAERSEESGATQSKIIPIASKSERSIQSAEVEELTFGDFLKYLVIIIIIVAIVIVIGGQLFQYKKSN